MPLLSDLLERAARATPAAVEDRGTGWWFRYTDNSTWWSGAVLAHGPADCLDRRIDAAERFYSDRDAVTRFQICTGCPAGLDGSLAERGYRWESPISVLTSVSGTRAEPHTGPGLTAHVDTSMGPDWLGVLGATSGPGTDVDNETRLLPRIDRPQAYITVLAENEPVGIGRAVADEGWTGVFNMATTPRARRRGAARLVLSAIARWADEHDAPRLYLQVEQSNGAAFRLYAIAGFGELATYHYRVQPTHTAR